MKSSWDVDAKASRGSERVPLGPLGDTLPSGFTADVVSGEHDLTARIKGRFEGERIEVTHLDLKRTSGAALTPRDVIKVPFTEIVTATGEAMVNPGHGAFLAKRHGMKPTPDELRLVAGVYWFRHATWGSPRQTIMGYWGLSRTSANRWITSAAELYPMPLREES